MRSNKIILVCLVIFAVVAIIGTYAGYGTTPVDQQVSDNTPYVNPYDTTTDDWWGFKDFFEWHTYAEAWPAIIYGFKHIIPDVPVVGPILESLGFISGLLLFQVEGVPDWLSVFFWILTFMLGLAIARVFGGVVTGGGD